MEKIVPKYKNIEDHIYVQTVPEYYVGYNNPSITVTVKDKKYDETQLLMLKSCLGEALLRFSAMAQAPLKAEIKL
jgi:hypothetical protein